MGDRLMLNVAFGVTHVLKLKKYKAFVKWTDTSSEHALSRWSQISSKEVSFITGKAAVH